MSNRWILEYLLGRKKLLALVIALNVINAITIVIIPVITGETIDIIVQGVSTGETSTNEIIGYSAIILLLAGLTFLFHALIFYTGQLYANKLCQALRSKIFVALQQQSHRYFDDHSTGDLVSKSTSDMINVWNIGDIPEEVSRGITQLSLILGLLFYYNPLIGLIALTSVPLMLLFIVAFERRFHPMVTEARTQFGQLNRIIQENIEGASVSRAFGAKKKEINRFKKENKRYRDLKLRYRRFEGAIFPQMRILSGIVSAIVLIVASYSVVRGNMTIGALVTVVLLTAMLSEPVDFISGFAAGLGEGKGAALRIREIIESTPEVVEHPNAIELPENAAGKIVFENVIFAYGNQPVLRNVNLTIPAGKSIALLGATGSGKSSLINLIPRFYDVSEGYVRIDDIDVRYLKVDSLRQRIGFVDQETFLFSKTVHENIAFGHPNASREEVIRVAKMAQAHDFIESMENSYETLLGERGTRLSGGQKQRIAIARALLADPLIVVMDDSLSAVDTKTEQEIKKATRALLASRTTLIVTQRLSSLSSADWIVLMKDGRIIEEGTHEELIALNGIYMRLLATQQDGLIDIEEIAKESFEASKGMVRNV
ncbi:MAG: ABC transporter ATP-binding protein [Candidatus Hodarchaeota archaeon]